MDPEILKELLGEFITESSENLTELERELLSYESGQSDEATINRIFRVVHTLKGSGGSLALSKLEGLSHEAEQLLDTVRELKMDVEPESVGLLLEVVDALRTILLSLQSEQHEGEGSYEELAQRVKEACEQLRDGGEECQPGVEVIEPEGEGANWGLFMESEPKSKRKAPSKSKGKEKAKAETAIEPVSENTEAGKASHAVELSESTIRVEIKQLDTLMALVGELVLTRNQLMQKAGEFGAGNIDQSFVHLDHLTSELQQGMMKTRMQPIGNAWTKLPRIVRDLAQGLGKEICLELDGKETELDRSLIEAIKDPLLHLVRNSVDHGIEGPDDRVKAGKDRKGLLFLSAYHESGQVNIDIMDDGRGIDLERLKRKAVDSGIESEASVERMSEREALNLIFHPGLSTAAQVSNISGRGVGMDVVRSNIEKIGGSIEVQSQPGQGTSIKLRIPLTLAIVPALLVGAGNERFAIPQLSLQELVQLEGDEVETKVESLYESKVYRLRGEIIPLVFLREQLCLEGGPERDQVMNIVVLQSEGEPYGLVVDAVYGSEEIVVKPLSHQLKRMSLYSGATILGDGSVALILDAQGFGRYCNALNRKRDDVGMGRAKEEDLDQKESTAMLLFNIGEGARMAVPLADVNRIEAVEAKQLESRRGNVILQHRGEILKIVDLSRYLPGVQPLQAREGEPLTIIVHSSNGRSIGLMISEVLDIVHEVIEIQEESEADGIVGSQSMAGKVTELLDLPRIMERVNPLYIEGTGKAMGDE